MVLLILYFDNIIDQAGSILNIPESNKPCDYHLTVLSNLQKTWRPYVPS